MRGNLYLRRNPGAWVVGAWVSNEAPKLRSSKLNIKNNLLFFLDTLYHSAIPIHRHSISSKCNSIHFKTLFSLTKLEDSLLNLRLCHHLIIIVLVIIILPPLILTHSSYLLSRNPLPHAIDLHQHSCVIVVLFGPTT